MEVFCNEKEVLKYAEKKSAEKNIHSEGENGMDYKKKIIEMVNKMNNQKFLQMIYGFIKRLYREEKAGS